MKKLSRSVAVGATLSLMILIGLTGSVGAAQAGPTSFNVGSVAYTTISNSTMANLEAFDLDWEDSRPNEACIGVWNVSGSGPVVSTCQNIKGNEQKYPQNLYVSGLIDNSLLSSGTKYNLRVDLIRHNQTIASSGFYTFTAGTDYSSAP